MKLKIGIQRVGSIVFGRILRQDESLRRKNVLASGGTVIGAIASVWYPSLHMGYLHIRGSHRNEDNRWFACAFGDDDEAVQAVNDIRMLIAQVNQCPPETPVDDCGLEVVE